MNVTARILIAAIVLLLAINARAASEIVIAVRYLQVEGTVPSHLCLYRDDGKFARHLTTDNSGRDVNPIFAPDGEAIVFARQKENSPVEFWSVHQHGGIPTKLDAAPDWLEHQLIGRIRRRR